MSPAMGQRARAFYEWLIYEVPFIRHTRVRRRARYCVWLHPEFGAIAYRKRFIWPALFLGFMWAVYRELWLAAVCLVVSEAVVSAHLPANVAPFINVAIALAFAFLAPKALGAKLARHGYRQLRDQWARSAPEAAHKAYARGEAGSGTQGTHLAM